MLLHCTLSWCMSVNGPISASLSSFSFSFSIIVDHFQLLSVFFSESEELAAQF